MIDAENDDVIVNDGITKEIAEQASSAMAGLEELALLDNGALSKIEELEKKIFYRQFYFPGDAAVKRLPGLGTDTKDVKYDQIPGDRDLFTRWDPRYLDDYIQQAQQNGFYRHFLYFDGNDVKSISYDEAFERLHGCLNGTGVLKGVGGCTEANVYGILAGLRYMDKLDSFMKEFRVDLGMSKKEVEQMINLYGADIVSVADKQLKRVIGQTKDEFIGKDYGWQAESIEYAFDVSQYAKEWNDAQEEYMKYKNKIWEILKNTNALNLCTNKTSGIQVGDVNIQQAMNCAMRIANEVDEKKEIEEVKNVDADVKEDEVKNVDVDVDVKQNEVKETEDVKNEEKENENEEVKKDEEEVIEETSDTGMNVLSIVLIIIGLILLCVGWYYLKVDATSETQILTENKDE